MTVIPPMPESKTPIGRALFIKTLAFVLRLEVPIPKQPESSREFPALLSPVFLDHPVSSHSYLGDKRNPQYRPLVWLFLHTKY